MSEKSVGNTEDGEHWRPESHWDDHDDFPPEDWQYEVANGDTRLGYIDWVNHQIEMVGAELESFLLHLPPQVWQSSNVQIIFQERKDALPEIIDHD